MANRRHWMAGTGVGVAAAALLMTGLTTTALGSVFPGAPAPAASPSTHPVPLNVPYLGWVTFAAVLNGAFLPIW